ncbi:MAG: hypothetical protein AAF744_05405 [Pseudomonadota bacterium]
MHYTEQDRLTEALLRNAAAMKEKQTVVAKPDQFRGLLRDTLNAMHKAQVSANARDVLLDAILGEATDIKPDRLILSDPNFFRTAGTAVQEGYFYPAAAKRMAYMQQLFPEEQIEIYMAIRDPGAILPIFHSVAMHPNEKMFWGDSSPRDLRWSELISEIRGAVPDIPITVWCNEDMPLIWGQVLREIAGYDENEKIAGGFDLLMHIMSTEGMQRFRAYLTNHPEMTEAQRRRVIAAFLDKFALEDEIEEEFEMPGWTEELMDELSTLYDADMKAIQAIPGVRLITP